MAERKRWFHSLLELPVRLLVKGTPIPERPVEEHLLDPEKPIVYLLKDDSHTDKVALARRCKALGLPDPFEPLQIDGREQSRVISVEKASRWLNSDDAGLPFRTQVLGILEAHRRSDELDVQIVPTGVYWGRAPGKEKPSLLAGLGDKSSPNWFRKMMLVLLLGRDSFIRFSKPVSLRQMADDFGINDRTAHRIVRVARVHFYRQRLMVTGPRLADRQAMFEQIVATPAMRKAIAEEVQAKSKSEEDARAEAIKYLDEIAANYSSNMIRVVDRIMTWLWNRIYRGIKVSNAEQVRSLAQSGHELVYVPCHRSHMDYLLLSYVLYYEGLVPPHIAAGVNLNFWPAGPLFRRGGAFFMRRSFRGNKLYSAVFREYLALLFQKGYSVEYFTEGGRSRTGRLLPPKTGMLAMTVQTLLRGGCDRPITLVPVYLGYEHVMEIGTYMKELKGKRKEKESAWQVLSAVRKLRNFGLGYVNFGKPISLTNFMNDKAPEWRDSINELEVQKPSWLTPTVNQLSQQVMREINNAGALNPINLCALSLLCAEQRSLSRKALEAQIALYLELIRQVPYHSQTTVPEEDAKALVSHAIELDKFSVVEDGIGEIISLEGKNAVLMTYYRNNIIHMFALPSLIASCVLRHRQLSEESLYRTVSEIYPMLKAELFMDWDEEGLKQQFAGQLNALENLGLITRKGELLQVPEHRSSKRNQLILLANIIQETLQRYTITLAQLTHNPGLERGQLESSSQKIAERLASLHGISAPEFFDKKVFSIFISSLREGGYMDEAEGPAKIKSLHQTISMLLATEVHQTIDEAVA
ncbi:glycerol-3-phosphate 1-O-acyltransferase PlsB [Corallincola holothuriorum]|uniref:Glycerol-3-phosphate acyltransferase n=1 Tax=Corallincola holothuriorum TaxID=2282215 RepID=A0A368NMM8_9GAMM|nr:glycerol-3-phosphate 1-O-acyltransferase PlsB [Corallincola holothuriorum]RCU51105.1 glycerol-3-phosphate 1-O-acyltransferase PlsB [Corallincola holothuriorum]